MFTALFGDGNGRILGEISPLVEAISWRINEVGQVPLAFPVNSQVLVSDFFQYGNTLLLQFTNGLPNWGGIIDPPGNWVAGNSTVSLSAYSGEVLLSFRTTGMSRYFNDANVGYIFRKVIEEANAIRDTGIRVDTPSFSAGTHKTDYHLTPLLTIAKDSIAKVLSASEFRVTPYKENGYIRFSAEIYDRLGSDLNGLALVEGQNITHAEYEEQGPIVNSYTAVGSGNTWGASRPAATFTDDNSVYTHRLREANIIQSDTSSPSSLAAIAENYVKKHKSPRRALSVTLIDVPPARFADYGIGDTILAVIPSVGAGGFNSRVRILSRSFNPNSNTCTAVLEETS